MGRNDIHDPDHLLGDWDRLRLRGLSQYCLSIFLSKFGKSGGYRMLLAGRAVEVFDDLGVRNKLYWPHLSHYVFLQ